MKKTVAIVTGATGGIGDEFVRQILQDKKVDELWAVGRNTEKLDSLVKKYGKRVVPVAADLSKCDSLRLIEKKLADEKSRDGKKQDEKNSVGTDIRIKYLVNNAGMAKMGRSDELTIEEVSSTIDVNCKAAVILSHMCIPYMKKGSRIINVSSASAFQPVPYLNLYSSTKVFLRYYSRALAMELKGTGITVTAVCPGWVDTDMLKKENDGKEIHFPGLTTAENVVTKALADSRRGKDMSICNSYARFLHIYGKLMPQKTVMRQWIKGIREYI